MGTSRNLPMRCFRAAERRRTSRGARGDLSLGMARPLVTFGAAMATKPLRELQTFPNPNRQRDYEIHFEAPEFTCLCPMTGQPDFATIRIRYIPDERCVELKSFKLYLWSYRDEGAFHETVTNRIADDLILALDPRYIEVE